MDYLRVGTSFSREEGEVATKTFIKGKIRRVVLVS